MPPSSAVAILVEIVEQYQKRGVDVCFVKLRSGNIVCAAEGDSAKIYIISQRRCQRENAKYT